MYAIVLCSSQNTGVTNGGMRITSWYSNFNRSHPGLPPSSVHKMTWLGGKNGVNDDVCAHAPLNKSSPSFYMNYYPGQKNRTIPEIRGEKNTVPSCDFMLDDARSAQGKSRGQSQMTLPCVDRASSSMISQDRTAFFSPRISGMVLFLSRVVETFLTSFVFNGLRSVQQQGKETN